MTQTLPRRTVLRLSALAGGGLAMGWTWEAQGREGPGGVQPPEGAPKPLSPSLSPFLNLNGDNTLEFFLDRVEMGQGTATSQPMLLCEELNFPLDRVLIRQAPVGKAYSNTSFGSQMTGGSTSVVEGHEKLRRAGAEVRERLRRAAAAAWSKPLDDIVAEQGRLHLRSDPSVEATYGAMAAAAVGVASPDIELKPWSSSQVLGSSPVRLDARDKATGQAIFGIDAAPEGCAVAVILNAPRPGLVPSVVDSSAARAMNGVLGVVEAAGGVAVIAERYWQARAAAPAVKLEWKPAAGSKPFEMNTQDLLEHHRKAAVTEARSHRSEGDWAQVFRNAPLKIQADYECPYLAHATMEPQNATVRLRKAEDTRGPRVEVWSGTQVPDLVVSEVAEVAGCAREEVVFHNAYLGGGFGRRLRGDVVVQALAVAQAAQPWLGDRALQLVYSREDDMKADDYRPMAVCHMLGSLDKDNAMSSLFCRVASQSILRQHGPDMVQTMAPQWLPTGLSRATAALVARFMGPTVALEGVKDTSYRCPNLRVEYAEVELPVRVGFWRSVGHSYTGFVMESFVDELAHLAKEDPYSFRRRHLEPGDRRVGVLDRVVQLAGWGAQLPEGVYEGLAVHKSFGSYVAEVCRVTVKDAEVRVLEVFCVVDCGRVVHPGIVRMQMESGIVYGLSAALYGEVTFDGGAAVPSNFHDYPVLRHDSCPRIVTEIVESNADPSGVGEPGTPPIAAALANAVFKATGKRIRSLPLSRALQASGSN